MNPHEPSGRLTPIAAASRRDQAVIEIRRAIVRGDLTPGTKLTELGLSRDLNISRATVREAVAQLVNEGFLNQEPYRGITVPGLSAKEMLDTARVRMALDMLAATSILEDDTGARIKRVRDAYEAYAAEASNPDVLGRHEAHLCFHREMWEASDNVMLSNYWPVTQSQIALQLVVDQRLADDYQRDISIHRNIVEALEKRDLKALEQALKVHTMDSVEALIKTCT